MGSMTRTLSTVMTVTGPVPPDRLGFTLVHEHMFFGNEIASGKETWDGVHDRETKDAELAYESLMRYKDVGGVTLVDQTTGGLRGRNGDVQLDQGLEPVKHSVAVRQMAERTGLNIVLGTGWYRMPYYEPYLHQIRTDELADELVRDITVGLYGTGVKAGLLGEIGVEHESWIWPVEERMLRAVARAHRETGVTIATHAVGGPVGLDQLDILTDEGVDPGRVIVGHVNKYPVREYHAELVRRGAFIAFDGLKGSISPIQQRQFLEYILLALDAGFIAHVLLSHDVCTRLQHVGYGGTGYDHIPTTFLGYLRENGVTDDQFYQMMVENPRRALTGSG